MHDEPTPEKLNALREFLATLDISLPKGGALRPDAFNRILARVKGRDVERLVNEVVLRTQAQAEYAPENFGHFGLNLRRYAHFTSPIRRYADLIVHRALIRALKLGPDGLAEGTDARALAEIAASISAAERRAMKAERETADRLIAHFLADRVGAIFDGHISGVTRAGLFVELDETGADGFVPARTIGDEYFRFDEAGRAFVGHFGDLPARRSGDRRAGRGGAGRRRAAVQAAARRSGRGARGLDIDRRGSGQSRTGRSGADGEAGPHERRHRKRGPRRQADRSERADRGPRAIEIASPICGRANSATLILIDRSAPVPKVLLGRRHERHRFMPGKFVFPGGRVEISDRQMPIATPLHERAHRAADAAREAAERGEGRRLCARRRARNL